MKIFKCNEVDTLETIYKDFKENDENWKKKKKNRKNTWYLNLPMSFDIETSSFYNNDEKQAIMYVWQFAVEDNVFIGRTWDEYINFIYKLSKIFNCDDKHRIVVYVHNLSYEFQWMRKYFNWSVVFASDDRKPIYAVDTNNVEYRCSYFLSGTDLAHTALELKHHDVKKLKGDLDYNIIHTPNTPLTEKEIGYCINDVLVVTAYIAEKIEQEGDITNIPLTKTGYVRRYCREHTLCNMSYKDLIHKLTLTPNEYIVAKDAFAGGFTHACAKNALKYFGPNDGLGSFDFTSSYPTVLISEKFPMSKGRLIKIKDKEDLYNHLEKECCIFRITLKNVSSKYKYEHYISESKCYYTKDCLTDNGRIVECKELCIAITNIDFAIIKFCYDFEIASVSNFYIYKPAYLPKEIIECVLHFYKQKTTLKGIKGQEVEYQLNKGMLNSVYGMMVTSIVKDEREYDNDTWTTEPQNIDEAIKSNNKSYNRFLFYPWGIFCTAYARYNLWTGITQFKDDYIYSDTDSIKCKNYKKHLSYIEKYNENIKKKIEKCLNYYNIPLEEYKPKNSKGIEKPMGIWDFEGEIDYFKTLGAKRYIYKNNEGWHFTVAGTGKISSLQYIMKQSNEDDLTILNSFNDDLSIPPEYTGKLVHTYIDEPIEGDVVDYQGSTYHYKELSCVHLEPASFNLSLTKQYLDYIYGLVQVRF